MTRPVVVIMLLYLQTMNYNSESCSLGIWNYFEKDKIYIALINKAKQYEVAKKDCNSYGGQLLIIKSQEKQTFVEKLVEEDNKCGSYFRIGLQYRDGILYWVDGTTIDMATDFNKLDEDDLVSEKQSCSTSRWCDDMVGWYGTLCLNNRIYICESEVPCGVTPVLSINGGNTIANVSTNITNHQNISLTCILPSLANEIEIECNGVTLEKGIERVTKTVFVDISMHERKCTCISKWTTTGRKDHSFVIFIVKTQPLYVNGTLNNTMFSGYKGENITIEIEIVARPSPRMIVLKRDNETVGMHEYSMTIETTTINYHYLITLAVIIDRTSTYDMTVQNSVPEDLEFQFTIKEKIIVKEGGNVLVFIIIGGVLLLLLLLVIAMLLCKGGSPAKEEEANAEEVVEEHTQRPSQAQSIAKSYTLGEGNDEEVISHNNESVVDDVDDGVKEIEYQEDEELAEDEV